MAEHIRVFEESKKKAVPVWAWLLPLLLVALLAFWFLRHSSGDSSNSASTGAIASASDSTANALPSLGTVHFETDSATLTPEDQATLDRAAEVIKGKTNVRLRVEGYTDSVGADAHNLTLSQQRALAVATYLKGKGVEASRLSGQGFGPDNPADSNATTAGKADNRRVELYTQP